MAYELGENSGNKQDVDTLRWNTQRYIQSRDAWEPARKQSVENYRYAEDKSWTDEKEAQLRGAGLPALSINLIWPRLLRISGQEKQVRKIMQAIPVKGNSQDGSVLANDIFSWIEFFSKVNNVFSLAFLDALVSQLGGWVENYYNTIVDPLGIPAVRRLSPFEVFDDPTVPMMDLRRKNYIIKSQMWSYAEIMSYVDNHFPQKMQEVKETLKHDEKYGIADRVTSWWSRIRGHKALDYMDFINAREGTYRIIEIQKRFPKVRWIATNTENGRRMEVKKEVAADLKQNYPHFDVFKHQTDEIRKQLSIADLVMLEDEPLEVQNGLMSIMPIAGFTLSGVSNGLVSKLKGPQDQYDKASSAFLAALQSVAASGWQIPEGSLDADQLQNLQENGSAPNYVQVFNRAYGRPEKIQPSIPDTGQLQRMDNAMRDMEFISAIGPDDLGIRQGSNENATLHRQRLQQAMLSLEPFFSNLDLTKTYTGEYQLDLVRKKIESMESDGRELSVPRTKQGDELRFENLFIGKDDLLDQYAIRPTVEADTETTRNKILAQLEIIGQKAPDIPEILIKQLQYSDLPENDIQELVQAIQRRTGGPSIEDQQNIMGALTEMDTQDRELGLAA